MPTTFDVKTQGVDQLINRLKGFEPEVYKILQRETKAAVNVIATDARGRIPGGPPLSHWGPTGRLGWDSSQVRGGLRPAFRTRSIGGTRYVAALVTNKSAAGALWQLAGARSVTQFGENINAKWGLAGKGDGPRALSPAWRAHVDQVREAIQDAINRAAEKVTNG